jgi:predicted ATPase
MSVGRLASNLAVGRGEDAILQEGGAAFVFHRPQYGDGALQLRWESGEGHYLLQLSRSRGDVRRAHEELWHTRLGHTIQREGNGVVIGRNVQENIYPDQNALAPGLRISASPYNNKVGEQYASIWRPLVRSQVVKLEIKALRTDSEVVPEPRLTQDGAGLAAVLGLWRGSKPEKCEELDSFLRKCLPEIRNALVRPAPVPGHQRLWFRQADGEEFDSQHVSDGVLCFTALTMHAIEAGSGQLLFIEEPEHSIHPRRLRELVDLLKELVASKGCQFVIATHSPVLLNAFRDEPEAIVLFRRSETGTRVKRLEDIPELRKALQDAPPGEMLESGFFNQEKF